MTESKQSSKADLPQHAGITSAGAPLEMPPSTATARHSAEPQAAEALRVKTNSQANYAAPVSAVTESEEPVQTVATQPNSDDISDHSQILNASISYTVSYRDLKRDGLTTTAQVHTEEDLPFGTSAHAETGSLTADANSSATANAESTTNNSDHAPIVSAADPAAVSDTSTSLSEPQVQANAAATTVATATAAGKAAAKAATAPDAPEDQMPAEVDNTSMAKSKLNNKFTKPSSNPLANTTDTKVKAPTAAQEAAINAALEKITAQSSNGNEAEPVPVDMIYDETPRLKIYNEQGQDTGAATEQDSTATAQAANTADGAQGAGAASAAGATGATATATASATTTTVAADTATNTKAVGSGNESSVESSAADDSADTEPQLYATDIEDDTDDHFDFSSMMAESIFSDEAKIPQRPKFPPREEAIAANATNAASAASAENTAPANNATPEAAPASPVVEPEDNSTASNANIMDNGTVMAFGHTAIIGMENRDPNKPTFTQQAKYKEDVSDSDRAILERIYSLNKTKRQKHRENNDATAPAAASAASAATTPAAAAASTGASATRVSNASSTTTNTTATPAAPATPIPEPLAHGPQGPNSTVATGSSKIIGADQSLSQRFTSSDNNRSGAQTARDRLRSTLSADQEAYMAERSTKAKNTMRLEPEMDHVGGDYAPNPNYMNQFSGDKLGSALEHEEFSGAGLGNAFDAGSLSGIAAPILREHEPSANASANANANASAPVAPALQKQPPHLTAEDLGGYPAMDPNDLPSRQEQKPLNYPKYDYSDMPIVDLQAPQPVDDGPHYVVGSPRHHEGEAFYRPAEEYAAELHNSSSSQSKLDPQDEADIPVLGQQNYLDPETNYHAPSYIQDHSSHSSPAAVSVEQGSSNSASANDDDDLLYPGVYATKLKRQQRLQQQQQQLQNQGVSLGMPAEQNETFPDHDAEVIAATNAATAAAVAATNPHSPANAAAGAAMQPLPNNVAEIDDDDLIYPGVYATKIKRQQKRLLQEQQAAQAEAEAAAKQAAAAEAMAQEVLNGEIIERQAEEELVTEPAGMGDGLLTQVDPDTIDSNGQNSGPHYVVGPNKRTMMAPPSSNNDVPLYAVGVARKNAEVEANLQAERERIHLAQMGAYGDNTQALDPEAQAQAAAEERAYEEALAEAARESMAAPNSEVIKNARALAAQGSKAQAYSNDRDTAVSNTIAGSSTDDLVTQARDELINNSIANAASAPTTGAGAVAGTVGRDGSSLLTQGQAVNAQKKPSRQKHVANAQEQISSRQRRENDSGQYNFANMPEKESIGAGMTIFLYLRQFFAAFFTYTSLPSIFPHLAMRLGPSYPSSMAIPFFIIGMLAGILGYTINHSLHMEHAGLVAFIVYTMLLGLPAYRGIYKVCTFVSRRRHDMILLVASVMIPMLLLMWLFDTILLTSSSIYEAAALLAIASMLSAATASTMMWNFPQDPIDSCGMMSGKGLCFVIVLCLMVSFGLLHYIVGLSVLGVSIVMRLIFGYGIARNQGTAQRPYVYALQLITLFAILLDLILLKSQNYEILSFSSTELLQQLRLLLGQSLGL